MRITKILNNNAVVVMDDGEEKIAIGAGVGFEKKKKDIVNQAKIEKVFVSKESEQLQQLLLRIPEEHFMITEEIIAYAEENLGTKLNDHIRIALTEDRKSTRLNSSHVAISYAVFCLKNK